MILKGAFCNTHSNLHMEKNEKKKKSSVKIPFTYVWDIYDNENKNIKMKNS